MQDVEVTLKEKVTSGASSATITITAKTGEDDSTGTIAVKVVKDILSVSEDLTAGTAISYTIGEAAGDDASGFTWLASDYVSDLATDGSEAITEEKTYGAITVLATATSTVTRNNKGSFELDLLGDGTNTSVTGYFQLGAGGTKDKKSMKFTVPADATAIRIFAKTGSSSNAPTVYLNNGTEDVLTEAAPSDYAAVVYTPSLTEDTTFYLYNPGTGGLNVKAIIVTTPEEVLESIAITTEPTKTEYAIGETLDTTGMVVKATYTRGSKTTTRTVTGWTTSGFDSSAAATDQEVTVSYTEGEGDSAVTKTATFKVTIKNKSLESIAVKTNPTKTEYEVGDTLDLTGLAITLTYDDASTADLDYSADSGISASGFDSSAAAESQTVTLTYKEKTTSFTVKISEPVVFTSLNFNDVEVADTGSKTVKNDKVSASDGTWEWGSSTTAGSVEVKTLTAAKPSFATEADGVYTYTAGGITYSKYLILNTKGGNPYYVKVFVGKGKTAYLRVDACAASGTFKNAELNVTGAETQKKTLYYVGTLYFTAVGDDDGWVTITQTAGDNKIAILGIYSVAAADVAEKTTVTLPDSVTNPVYTNPVISLSETEVKNEDDTSVTITVDTKATASAYTVYSDGTADVDVTEPDLEYAISGTDGAGMLPTISGTTITVSSSTSVDTYTVTGAVKVGGETKASGTAELKVKDASAATYEVTFDANGGTITTSSAPLASGDKLPTASTLGLTNGTKSFSGWAKTASGSVEYADGAEITLSAAVTLYAVWSDTTTYKFIPAYVTEETAATAGDAFSDTTTAKSFTFKNNSLIRRLRTNATSWKFKSGNQMTVTVGESVVIKSGQSISLTGNGLAFSGLKAPFTVKVVAEKPSSSRVLAFHNSAVHMNQTDTLPYADVYDQTTASGVSISSLPAEGTWTVNAADSATQDITKINKASICKVYTYTYSGTENNVELDILASNDTDIYLIELTATNN